MQPRSTLDGEELERGEEHRKTVVGVLEHRRGVQVPRVVAATASLELRQCESLHAGGEMESQVITLCAYLVKTSLGGPFLSAKLGSSSIHSRSIEKRCSVAKYVGNLEWQWIVCISSAEDNAKAYGSS